MRKKEVIRFWSQQPATVESMCLRANVRDLAQEEQSELLSYLPHLQGGTLLELASGIGRMTRYFSSQARHLTSVDLVAHFIEKNRKDHADCLNVDWICADAMDLNFKRETFDLIFCNWLFMYLKDAETKQLIERIYNWLKPSGQLFFRESCALKTTTKKHVTYRSLGYYDSLIKKRFRLIREGHLHTYVKYFSTPLQCYWLGQKYT